MKPKSLPAASLCQPLTATDIELLANVDEAHETLSGPATQKILQRELHEFDDTGYQRLAGISVAQIIPLRKSRTLPATPRRLSAHPAHAGSHRRAQTARTRKAVRDICGWIRFIRATWTESKACITSTRWMK